jgi:hypothetical protein
MLTMTMTIEQLKQLHMEGALVSNLRDMGVNSITVDWVRELCDEEDFELALEKLQGDSELHAAVVEAYVTVKFGGYIPTIANLQHLSKTGKGLVKYSANGEIDYPQTSFVEGVGRLVSEVTRYGVYDLGICIKVAFYGVIDDESVTYAKEFNFMPLGELKVFSVLELDPLAVVELWKQFNK